MAASKLAKRGRPDVKAIASRAERARPKPLNPTAKERAAETRQRAADEKRVRGLLADIASVAPLEQLAREREKSNVQRAETTHRKAIAASSQRAKWIATQGVQLGVLEPFDGDRQEIIDTAAWMRAWPSTGALRDWNTSAGDNWGKYRLEIDGDILDAPDEARLSFYALWQNREDVDVTVSIATRLDVNAHLSAHADGRRFSSIFIPGATADGTLRARLTLTPVWLQNTQFTAAETEIGSVSARGGFFGDDASTSIFTSTFLDSTLAITVPAGRFLMLETSLVTDWKIDSGSVRVDAEQGAFKIAVPFWVVTIAQG